MKSTLTVSSRGQITLPSSLRKKMGIENGGIIKVEEQNGKILLTPAVVMSTRMYTDEEIRIWAEENRLNPEERVEIIRKIDKRLGH